MQSIGERLEEARKRKGISIREAAEATKIRSDYLHKFESSQFDIRLPEIYIRGFLRNYATYLKVPADKIINDYNGLGLGENKQQRGLSREVYGRMDLSVGSKLDKEPKEPGPAAAGPDAVATAADATPKNPATFVPRATGRAPLDRDLLIKAGILIGITVVVVLVAVWAFSGRSDKPSTAIANSTTDAIWIRPLAGEPVLTLVASGAVSVTVTTKTDNTTLYQGTIPRGDIRSIPRRGGLRVEADPHQSLQFEIGGKRYPMPPQRTAEISPP